MMKTLKVIVGIQARTSSKRLKNKVYQKLHGKTLLQWVWDACSSIKLGKRFGEVIPLFLIPMDDSKIAAELCKMKASFRAFPNEDDVMGRYLSAAEGYDADLIIRVTADCPTIPSWMILNCIHQLMDVDYCSNTIIRSYYEGWDVQGCSFDALKYIASVEADKEHPFKFFDANGSCRDEFIKQGFTWNQLINKDNPIFRKLSVDTEADLKRLHEFTAKGG